MFYPGGAFSLDSALSWAIRSHGAKDQADWPPNDDAYSAEDLLRWRRQSAYAMPDDYIFASETMRGKQPFWPGNLMKRHIRPIASIAPVSVAFWAEEFRLRFFDTIHSRNGDSFVGLRSLVRGQF